MLALWIGRPLAFLDAQKVVWERRLSPAGPLGGVVAAVQHHELLDLAVAIALIVLGIVAWRRIGAAYGLYALVSVALPLSFVSDKTPLWSMQRFAVVVFPAFMALATLVRSRRGTCSSRRSSARGSRCMWSDGPCGTGLREARISSDGLIEPAARRRCARPGGLSPGSR